MQNTRADWAFMTVPQRELFGRRIAFPRGRVVGGTSILNYMMYIRGNAGDYDEWAQAGNTGWSYADVLPYFKKAETNANFNNKYHGRTGPLSVETNRHRHALCDLFIEAAKERGLAFNPDFNGQVQEGCGFYQASQHNGLRSSTSEAYLNPVRNRANLTIIKDAHVTRVVIERGRAVGVEYLAGGRHETTLRAEVEIILSAGSIGSPHIMLLSGLGPAAQLSEHGIKVIADLAAVGQNLEDHLGVGSLWVYLKDPDAVYGKLPTTFDDALAEFERTGGGLLATHYLDVGAFYSVDPGTKYPQCQTVMLPGIIEFYRTDGAPDRSRFRVGGWPCRSKSRGSVTLVSANPLDQPLIDPNYLSDPDDLRLSKSQIKWTRELLNSKAFDHIRAGLAQPEFGGDADIENHVRRNASTIWHPTSTCRMGVVGNSVVGQDLRVHGIEGLSICDASIMPSIVSGNTNAPTIMIAEKGADLIRSR
jgi:choline dehydrogenase